LNQLACSPILVWGTGMGLWDLAGLAGVAMVRGLRSLRDHSEGA
jgi:hypothetical protein